MDVLSTADLRITFVENADDDYPWPWTAFLQERDDDEWPTISYADGMSPDDALAQLRAYDARAVEVAVKVPRWKRKARVSGQKLDSPEAPR
jgi:hypothetical protein